MKKIFSVLTVLFLFSYSTISLQATELWNSNWQQVINYQEKNYVVDMQQIDQQTTGVSVTFINDEQENWIKDSYNKSLTGLYFVISPTHITHVGTVLYESQYTVDYTSDGKAYYTWDYITPGVVVYSSHGFRITSSETVIHNTTESGKQSVIEVFTTWVTDISYPTPSYGQYKLPENE